MVHRHPSIAQCVTPWSHNPCMALPRCGANGAGLRLESRAVPGEGRRPGRRPRRPDPGRGRRDRGRGSEASRCLRGAQPAQEAQEGPSSPAPPAPPALTEMPRAPPRKPNKYPHSEGAGILTRRAGRGGASGRPQRPEQPGSCLASLTLAGPRPGLALPGCERGRSPSAAQRG